MPPPAGPHFAYGRQFWLAYTSNALLLVAVALLFRYADFVTLLGGTEFHLGWIVGIGTVGSLFTRLLLGSWLDRYGTRLLWIGSCCCSRPRASPTWPCEATRAWPSTCCASRIAARWRGPTAPR